MSTKEEKREDRERDEKVVESVRPAGGHNTQSKPGNQNAQGDAGDRKEKQQSAQASTDATPQPEVQDPTLAAVTGVIEDAFGGGAETRHSTTAQFNEPCEVDSAFSTRQPGSRPGEGERYLELDAKLASKKEAPDSVGD